MNREWMKRAACRGMNSDLFFPKSMKDPKAEAAKKICRDCPVAIDCYQMALENDEPCGIWGGQGRKQRTVALKKSKETAS